MRLLLIDHKDIFEGLPKKDLSDAGFEYDHVTTVAEGINAVAATRYAVLIIDINLPDGDGCALVENVRARGDRTPIVMLTQRLGVEEKLKGLQAGADDCLAKPFEFDELVGRVRALLRRPSEFLGTSLRVGNVAFDTLARQAFVNGIPQALSWRELVLLEMLIKRPGHVFQKRAIESHLFGLLAKANSNAVEVYVHRLRKILNDAGASVQVRTVRGVGYILTPGDAHPGHMDY